MKKFLLLTVSILCFCAFGVSAKKTAANEPRHFTQLLWNGEAPHKKVIRPDANGNLRQPKDVGDTAKIHVYLPAPSKANGKAVVFCPGGAYAMLCMTYEGWDWANFLNEEGIALVVLQYRLPEGNWQIPVEDVQEAIRLTRRNAKEWNINPDMVGVGGFSAGGHLASTASTHFNSPVNADAVSCRPDFSVLFYPVISLMPQMTHYDSRRNFLGPNIDNKEILFSNELQVTAETPRTWLAFSHDDDCVPPQNGVRYYEALLNNHVPASFHIYPSGGHGWGIQTGFRYHKEMLADLSSWLRSF